MMKNIWNNQTKDQKGNKMSYIKALSYDYDKKQYRVEIANEVGGILPAIVLQQLTYWTRINKGSFYKFIEPCGHDNYKNGDSWTEELGMSKYQFTEALKKLETIGVADHKTDSNRMTWYTINNNKLEELLEKIYGEKPQMEALIANNTIKERETKQPLLADYTKDNNGNYYDNEGNWISERVLEQMKIK